MDRRRLKRGEVYTAATGSGLLSKPRPVVILQADTHLLLPKIVVVLLTSEVEPLTYTRPIIEMTQENGLRKRSQAMIDSLVPVPIDKFGDRAGQLSRPDMERIERALLLLLGFVS